jgi:hypothetical protein
LSVNVTLAQVATYGATDNGNANLAPLLARNKAAEAGLLNLRFTLNLNAEKRRRLSAGLDGRAGPAPEHRTVNSDGSCAESDRTRTKPLVPVNVIVSVHEVGDPGVFLAALNQAAQSSGADLAKPLAMARLPPAGTLSLAQTNDKNRASVNTLAATYQKDLSAFAKECANPSVNTTHEKEKAPISSLFGRSRCRTIR